MKITLQELLEEVNPLPWASDGCEVSSGRALILSGHYEQDGKITNPDAVLARHAANQIEGLVEALRRISYAKPDRLDHARDVAIIERAARIAGEALAKAESVTL